jgi:uncharacterized membrane protein YcaP (DUF421 family)
MRELLGIALRASILFAYVLAVLRLSGKRSLHHLSPLDFVLATAVGDLVDDIVWAEVPLVQGLVGLTTMVLVPMLVSHVASKHEAVARLVDGTPTRVLRDGRWVGEGLRRERTSEDEVRGALRLRGEDRIEEVEQACWEPSGGLSVRRTEPARTAEKRDRSYR